MTTSKPYRIIISGGGTGGHIYPAVAIANELKCRFPDADILFVGALGRMEMEKVPKAGYRIIGLPIAGIQRRLTWKNLLVPFKLVKSLMMAKKIVKDFQPDVAVGVGGYASGPLLKAAVKQGVPAVLQEQNSYAGLTNKLLAKEVKRICVAYEGMGAYFPKEKLVLTGNPVRKDIVDSHLLGTEAKAKFGLEPTKCTVLIIGGSLGARTLNDSVAEGVQVLKEAGLQVIWQTGSYYYEKLKGLQQTGVCIKDFVYNMDEAYAAADVVISRAGALSVSELCLVSKPSVLVPSPNVAEDHQTKNAMALVNKGAALMVRDDEAQEKLVPVVISLSQDEKLKEKLKESIQKMGKPRAAEEIVDEIVKLMNK